MPSLEDLTRNTVKTDIDIAGETLTVTYRPGEITEASLDPTLPLKDTLVQLIESWNLTKKRGKSKVTIPITLEGMAEVPIPIQQAILRGILRDSGDLGEVSENSPGG